MKSVDKEIVVDVSNVINYVMTKLNNIVFIQLAVELDYDSLGESPFSLLI